MTASSRDITVGMPTYHQALAAARAERKCIIHRIRPAFGCEFCRIAAYGQHPCPRCGNQREVTAGGLWCPTCERATP